MAFIPQDRPPRAGGRFTLLKSAYSNRCPVCEELRTVGDHRACSKLTKKVFDGGFETEADYEAARLATKAEYFRRWDRMVDNLSDGDPLKEVCPLCGVKAGLRCRAPGGGTARRGFHSVRKNRAMRRAEDAACAAKEVNHECGNT